ncbi:NUDIX hydrolase [Candidatus Woesearchaeota archaeon]|nr:NUDIX hydrolase [Candidatus Woesearchaeota archaeon]
MAWNTFSVEGKTYRADFVPQKTWENLSPITQSYGMCFRSDGKILIVKGSDVWHLPGGTVEKGETPEQTLEREVWEEGTVKIGKKEMIGYQNIKEILPDGKTIDRGKQLRFVTLISEVCEHTKDPCIGKKMDRKFISPEEFSECLKWGPVGDAILNEALKVYDKWKSS